MACLIEALAYLKYMNTIVDKRKEMRPPSLMPEHTGNNRINRKGPSRDGQANKRSAQNIACYFIPYI